MADDVERAASALDVLVVFGTDDTLVGDYRRAKERLIAAAEARGREQPVCDCHTWPTQKELHDYTMAVEAERDAALLLAGEALALLRKSRTTVDSPDHGNTINHYCGLCGAYGPTDVHEPKCIFAGELAQAALAKWREQQ